MKNLIIIFCLIFNFGCTNKEQKNNFKIFISSLEKPHDLITNYELTNDSLIISTQPYIWLEDSKKPEEIIFKYGLTSKDKKIIFTKSEELNLNQNFEEIYFNECIIDGLELFIYFEQKENKYSTSIHNYYEPRINKLVQIINKFVSKEYQIWYDKGELTNSIKNCK